MTMFDFSSRQADLTNKYNQDNAAQEFGRMLGQQRYSRQRDLYNTQYQRQFPSLTANWAHRLGSGVQSGVMRENLANNVNDYLGNLNSLDTQWTQQDAQFAADKAAREAAYRQMLQSLQEDYNRQLMGQSAISSV